MLTKISLAGIHSKPLRTVQKCVGRTASFPCAAPKASSHPPHSEARNKKERREKDIFQILSLPLKYNHETPTKFNLSNSLHVQLSMLQFKKEKG